MSHEFKVGDLVYSVPSEHAIMLRITKITYSEILGCRIYRTERVDGRYGYWMKGDNFRRAYFPCPMVT